MPRDRSKGPSCSAERGRHWPRLAFARERLARSPKLVTAILLNHPNRAKQFVATPLFVERAVRTRAVLNSEHLPPRALNQGNGPIMTGSHPAASRTGSPRTQCLNWAAKRDSYRPAPRSTAMASNLHDSGPSSARRGQIRRIRAPSQPFWCLICVSNCVSPQPLRIGVGNGLTILLPS
jgi:hypothetical protein